MIYESPHYLYSGDQYLTIEIGDEMGYQMMGVTPVPIYDRHQSLSSFEKSPVLLRIGDRLRFVPVDAEECDFIRQKVWEESYEFKIKKESYSI
jgi:allophanate hydrolase subunit 1